MAKKKLTLDEAVTALGQTILRARAEVRGRNRREQANPARSRIPDVLWREGTEIFLSRFFTESAYRKKTPGAHMNPCGEYVVAIKWTVSEWRETTSMVTPRNGCRIEIPRGAYLPSVLPRR